jgi:hypothetical protein
MWSAELPLLFLLMVQATHAAPREKIDLTVPAPCAAHRVANGEIVVCARRPDGPSPYRISQPPARQPEVPKAKVQISEGVSASAETEHADIGGFPSNRLMLRLKIKF